MNSSPRALSSGSPLLFALDSHPLITLLATALSADTGTARHRYFPDGEFYLQITSEVKNRHCVVIADLSRPNARYLPLVFLLDTLRAFGAASVGLVAPYLCYMRQDTRFQEGEALTSKLFAKNLSGHIDWLVTVDPHLHRYHSLSEIYSVPTRVVNGAPVLAAWLKEQKNVFLVGPDAESEQWVRGISAISGHPYVIGKKQRLGDRRVRVSLPALTSHADMAAVIIDDVISSGHTVLECVAALQAGGVDDISCAAVHGIFAEGSDQLLQDAGLRQLLTCNTVVHPSNSLDVSPLLVEPVEACIGEIMENSE